MSVRAMTIVWESDLTRSEKMILLAYADHADHDGKNIYPAVSRIAWKTGYSKRQVQRITRDLVAKGFISELGTSKYKTILYQINLDNLPALPPYTGDDKMSPIEDDKMSPVDKMSPSDGQNVTFKGDTAMSPKPSLNHPYKPSNSGSFSFSRNDWKTFLTEAKNAISRPSYETYLETADFETVDASGELPLVVVKAKDQYAADWLNHQGSLSVLVGVIGGSPAKIYARPPKGV